MNSYTLSSESARWWWPTAAAAAVAITALGAITAGPAIFNDTPTEPDIITPMPGPARTCLNGSAHWNSALHGLPPLCGQAQQAPGTAGRDRQPDRELPLP